MKTLRIFISSPGDVAEERDRARQVVEQLRQRYAGQLDLKAVLWEELPLQADMSFQQGIDVILSAEKGVDIAVFILWSRLGSPLGRGILKPDGSLYRSGTEREFDLIIEARRQKGGDSPKILIYTRRDEASFDEHLRGKSTDAKDQLIAQKKLVENFIQEEFHDAATGTNIRAYHSFDQPLTFSQRLRIHLQEMLDPVAGGFSGEPVWNVAKSGSPFRGLEVFEFCHCAVFFGREDEVLEVRRALQRKALEGCAFVLISGASGSGKSSLVRAGVLPAVVENEVDSMVNGWRYLVCTPSQLGSELCVGFAKLLCAKDVLPELPSASILAEGFACGPKLTVDQSLRPALERASRGKSGTIRLLVLVDQLEELFTDKRLTDADRERFVAMLEALAQSGVVWVLATVRSDFYQHCQRVPSLIRMKAGPGQIDLLVPAADAIGRLIVHPARLAGLRFEDRDGSSLADRILGDASAHPELLPLLSYLLRELFEQRTDKGVLTFAAYEKLGGVEGALAKRAETVFGSLPPAAQGRLIPILRALVSVSGDEEESVVRQRVRLDDFAPETPDRVLVDRFVAERFFVTDVGADGVGTLAVAHEALLRTWSRAAQWIADNREFLRVRARVVARMKEGSRLLDGDPLLDAARLYLATTRDGFTSGQAAYIEENISAVQKARAHRERLRQRVTIGLAFLLVAAVGGGIYARIQREEAIVAEQVAEQQKKEADGAREVAEARRIEAIKTASATDFAFAGLKMEKEDWPATMAYLAASLRINPQSEKAMVMAVSLIRSLPLPNVVMRYDNQIESANFSPDGKRVVTATGDIARVWDAHTGQPIGQPMKHDGTVNSARFSPDGKWVVTASRDKTARVWDAQTGQPVSPPMKHDGNVASAIFSPDSKWVLIEAANNTERVWDAQTGQPVSPPIKRDGHVAFANLSPDGKWMVTASNDETVRVWDAQTGQAVGQPMKHDGYVHSTKFSPDGKWMVTASEDKTARVWDAHTGQLVGQPMKHDSSVNSASFSPDGKYVLTVAADKTVRVWDAQTDQPVGQPMKHNSWVNSASFSPDGKWVVTASADKTAQVWDAHTGQPIGQPMQHNGDIHSVSFSPDGKWVVTVSVDAAQVWDAKTGQPLGLPIKHEHKVNSASFSPDNKWVVTASNDRTARVWDAHTGQPIGQPMKHDGWAYAASFSPDGKWVVTASEDHTARVWDAQTGQPVGQPMKHEDTVRSASFSPDGKWVLTVAGDKTERVWDAQTGLPAGQPMKHDRYVHSAEFSPDGKWVVTAANDDTVQVWDAKMGQPVGQPIKHDSYIDTASFSPDGKWVVMASEDHTARVWDAQTGQPVGQPMKHEDSVDSLSFSPDGKWVLTVAGGKSVRVWDAHTGQLMGQPMQHDYGVNSALFSPDGKWVLTVAGDNIVRVWDARTGQLTGQPMRHDGYVASAYFSPDGKLVMTASVGKTAQVWDAQTGQAVGQPMMHGGYMGFATFSPDGKLILTVSYDQTVQVWDTPTSQPVGQPMVHEDSIKSASFSSDGKRIVTESSDDTERVWDAQTGQPVGQPTKHDNSSNSAKFSPDSKWVLTVSGHTARVLDLLSGQPLGQPMKHDADVRFVGFSPDGKWVVTASDDHTARVWDAQTSQPVGQPMKHDGYVATAYFSPDGKWVVTASEDSTARVWDAQTGQPVGQPMKHEDSVNSASFSPDGKWVVTASNDKTARVWDAQTGQPICPPMKHEDSVNSASFSPDGKWVVTASNDGTVWVWDTVIADKEAPSWLSGLTEVNGGQRINPQGVLEFSPQDPTQLHSELQKLSGDDDLSRFGRWIAANPTTRTIGPLSTITVPEFVAARLQENTPASIQEAYNADPGNPLVLASLAKLTFENDKDEARFYFQVALRYARLAGAPGQITQIETMAKALFPDAPEFSDATSVPVSNIR